MPTIARPEALGPYEAAPHRSFAHPDHVAADRAVLCLLIADFSTHLAAAPRGAPAVCHVPDVDEWHRRIVIPKPEALDAVTTVTVVGFFGRVADAVDDEVATRIKSLGESLVGTVLETPGVLGYTTHLLVDERNYANLVLVESPEVIERWRNARLHQTAAEEWSPRYYQHVRIYRGSIDSLDQDCTTALRLESVKYWDFRCDPVWHAIRSLQ